MPYHSKTKGFTLIEILVVIMIIGIISAAALYAFGDFGGSRKVLASAEYFKSYVDLLQHRAIIESNALGIRITPKGYQTYRLVDGKTWTLMPQTGIFKSKVFPLNMVVQFKNTFKTSGNQPNLTISPTGDLTPMLLAFGTEKSPNTVQFSTLKNDKTELLYE